MSQRTRTAFTCFKDGWTKWATSAPFDGDFTTTACSPYVVCKLSKPFTAHIRHACKSCAVARYLLCGYHHVHLSRDGGQRENAGGLKLAPGGRSSNASNASCRHCRHAGPANAGNALLIRAGAGSESLLGRHPVHALARPGLSRSVPPNVVLSRNCPALPDWENKSRIRLLLP